MKYFMLLILMGCASNPLKFKYSSSKPYLGSLTDDSIHVAKITVSLKNPKIFASGMDSTTLIVKLYDKKGELLRDVDPSDLTLSTSEDIEAKPFVVKKTTYKAALLPRVNSRSVRMQVDWQDKIRSEEVVLVTTVKPMKETLLPMNHDFSISHSFEEVSVGRGSSFPETGTESFSFVNVGDNKIVTKPNTSRSFNFDYPEHASQNIMLQVDDAPNAKVSHTMHSVFMFFPRKQLPLVQQLSGTIEVTLPTGEKVIYQKESKEIVSGVFEEGPVDYHKDRDHRTYPDLKYKGRGVVLRVNARGQSPELGSSADKVKIDMDFGSTGSAEVLIINGSTGQKCRRPKADFWEPIDVTPIEFKFARDADFEVYLKANCGFGLPKLDGLNAKNDPAKNEKKSAHRNDHGKDFHPTQDIKVAVKREE